MSATSPARLRIVLAEDHAIVREGIRSALEHVVYKYSLQVVGEASDGYAAVKLCEAHRPDIALVDVTLPLLNGIDATREIRRCCPDTKAILLTVHPDESYVLAGLRAGACGYVVKSSAVSNLLEAIDAAMRGDIYLSPTVSRALVNAYLSTGEAQAPDPLSAREREVLQLIAEGRTMREIGELLGISARTAETHRARIMEKLNIHDIAGLVRYAIAHGLISVDDD